jgi:hypothetical protein
MTQESGGGAPGAAATMARLNADRDWLAARGIELTQYGPDPGSGKVRVYLARYTEEARQLLDARYGPAIVVATESRNWRFS